MVDNTMAAAVKGEWRNCFRTDNGQN